MKFLTLLLSFCLLSIPSLSQEEDADALYKKIEALKEKGDYEKAISLAERLLEVTKQKAGDVSIHYYYDVKYLAGIYALAGRIEKAEERYLQALQLIIKIQGEKGGNYESLIEDIGNFYLKTRQYEKAEPFILKELEKWQRMGEDLTTAILEKLADLYILMQAYHKAEAFLLKSYSIRERLAKGFPDNSLIQTMTKLAEFYQKMQDYNKAEALLIKAVGLYNNRILPNEYAIALNNLAIFYYRQGKFDKSVPILERAINIRRNRQERNIRLATAINNLATSYLRLHQYDKAESLYTEALDMIKILYGEGSTFYAEQLQQNGVFYTSTGNYAKAESLLLAAERIFRTTTGEKSIANAHLLGNLGWLYQNLVQFSKADKLYISALKILREATADDTEEYQNIEINHGLMFVMAGDFARAMDIFYKGLATAEKVNGKQHPNYAGALTRIGFYNVKLGFQKEALKYLLQASSVLNSRYGHDHPALIENKALLADAYMMDENYVAADSLLQAVFAYYSQLNDKERAEIAMYKLGILNHCIGKTAKAEELLISFLEGRWQRISGAFDILSEKEKNILLGHQTAYLEELSSMQYRRPLGDKFKTALLNFLLSYKSLSLTSSAEVMRNIRSSKDSVTIQVYNQWKGHKASLQSKVITDRNTQDSLEHLVEQLEKELVRRSAAFNAAKRSLQVTMKTVQEKLEPGEVAVEFYRFRLNTSSISPDSMMYVAYIINKVNTTPTVVHLFEEKQLQQLFNEAGKDVSTRITNLYRAGVKAPKTAAPRADSLYKLVWEPLEPYVKDAVTISYSPAGKLYNISFSAMAAGENKILLDRYHLKQYTGIRQLALRETAPLKKPANIMLFGDASFSIDSSELAKKVPGNTTTISVYSAGGDAWQQLPGTAAEVKKIQELFTLNKIKSNVYTQRSVSEELLKQLNAKAPTILHIATHGFFLPEPKSKVNRVIDPTYEPAASENPLMRSGIILAGANFFWKGGVIQGIEDGIFTAYEISQLDLANTNLVVLSACETALGDIKGSEGVFGLQRGFKLAGVKRMIVSLWQVPDKETAELMITFYSEWLKGKTIERAFEYAQKQMRSKYSPFYWAAFTLVD